MPHPEQGGKQPAPLTQAEQRGSPRRGLSLFLEKLLPSSPSVLSRHPLIPFLTSPTTLSFTDQSPQDQGKERTIPFAEYNGWPNRPTWEVYMVMTSYYETYQAIESIADEQTPEAVREFVTGSVDTWKQGSYTPIRTRCVSWRRIL